MLVLQALAKQPGMHRPELHCREINSQTTIDVKSDIASNVINSKNNVMQFRKLEKAVAVSGVCSGFSGKTPGKSRENCWKIFPESRNATNSGISGTGKSQTCREPCVDTAGTLSPPSVRGVF